MKGHLLVIAAITMLVVSTSGCLDVHQAKDIFIPEKHPVITYTNTTRYITYEFTTDPGNPSSMQHESNTMIPIKNRTKEMRIDITTTLLATSEIFENTPMVNTTALQQLLEELSMLNATLQQFTTLFPFINVFINVSALQNLQVTQAQLIENITNMMSKEISSTPRYIDITIKTPDSQIWYQHRFNQSEVINMEPIKTPMDGNWEIFVDAKGVGFSIDLPIYKFSYHDGYSIRIMSEEPAE